MRALRSSWNLGLLPLIPGHSPQREKGAGYLISVTPPIYATNASGTVTDPSAF